MRLKYTLFGKPEAVILSLLAFLPFFALSQRSTQAYEDEFLEPDTIVFFSNEEVEFVSGPLLFNLYAVDGNTLKPVSAQFKIINKSSNKTISGYINEDKYYQAHAVFGEEYIIVVNAPGYLDYTESVLITNHHEREIFKAIALEKTRFNCNLKAKDGITGKTISNAAITLINLTNHETIHTLVNPATGECIAEFDLNNEYSVEVIADGYKKYFKNFLPTEKLDAKVLTLMPETSQRVLKLQVVDAASGNALEADIALEDTDENEIPVKEKRGYYESGVNNGYTYSLSIYANGYQEYQEVFTVGPEWPNARKLVLMEKGSPRQKLTKEVTGLKEEVFENLESGTAVPLNNIIFDQSKYTLREESYEELNKLVTTLKVNKHLHIVIAGHTDNRGDKRLNQLLSQNRAKVIANYLIERGIEEDRLEVIGYGSQRPIAPNDTEENRMKNRRVEFVVK